jgi:hypothetical protein
MNLTQAEVENIVRFGDTAVVHYRDKNGLAKAMEWFEGGHATHQINCLGGLDIVEELCGGGSRSNLYSYMRGQCDLTIKRAPRPISAAGAPKVKAYWLGLVGKGYGWDSIKRAFLTVPIRRFVKPRAPRLAHAMTVLARVLLPGKMVDCSASWLAGIRLDQPNILVDYDPQEVSPETTLRDEHLITVARWKAPFLVD